MIRLSHNIGRYADAEDDSRTTTLEAARTCALVDHGADPAEFQAFRDEHERLIDGKIRIPARQLAWWLGY